MDNPDSIEFRQPVDYKRLGLTDYPVLIPYQMDLGTVKKKLSGGKYSLVEETIDDILMVWQNCKTYNAEGSWIYNLADKLERYTKKIFKNQFANIPLTVSKEPASGNANTQSATNANSANNNNSAVNNNSNINNNNSAIMASTNNNSSSLDSQQQSQQQSAPQ